MLKLRLVSDMKHIAATQRKIGNQNNFILFLEDGSKQAIYNDEKIEEQSQKQILYDTVGETTANENNR